MVASKEQVVYVTGANGFLGQAVCRMLTNSGFLVQANQLDLTDMSGWEIPGPVDLILHLAADVKGIIPNRAEPYRFMRRNSLMALNVIEMSRQMGGVPIVAAGSVCAYPEDARLPFNEPDFWMGKPDRNNLGYGMAKRFMAGALECAEIEFGLRYVHVISANLYGPGDHFDAVAGHVIPSLIVRIYQAKVNNEPRVIIWGSGQATRDFLYVEDAARAYVNAIDYLLNGKCSLECNIGSGTERSIQSVAITIANLLEYDGELVFDITKPSGQMRRRVDTNKGEHFLDWFPITNFQGGLANTIGWYKRQIVA